LRARGMEVMLDDLVSESLAGGLRAGQAVDRLMERAGDAARLGLIGVAFDLLRRIDPVPYAVEPRGDRRREGEIRVRVGPGDPVLHAIGLPFPDRAKAAGPVVA